MNIKPPLLLSLSLTLTLLAGCRVEQAATEAEPLADTEAEAEVLPPPLPEPNPIDATSVIDHGSAGDAPAQAGALDTKALAGRFSDGNSLLELRSDGTYVQTLTIEGTGLNATGTWSAIGPAALLLDPSSKSAADAVFLVASNDELESEDGTLTFRRVAAR
jgi:hypothetical protein